MNNMLVVTDLDGTLLDEAYSFDAARPALETLRDRGISVVINSSKTAAECRFWQSELNIEGPYICENGAGIHSADASGRVQVLAELAPARQRILEVLGELRAAGFEFSGFGDWTIEELMTATGLPRQQAQLAQDRLYSEPLMLGGSQDSLPAFRAALAEHDLVAVQGGRFLTVTGQCDKGAAMLRLQAQLGHPGPLVALGDSHNDVTMLNSADCAVIIASKHAASIELDKPGTIIRTELSGPAGWQYAITQLLKDTTHG